MGLNTLLFHFLTTVNGERTLIVVLDNAPDQLNQWLPKFLQMLVDCGACDVAIAVMSFRLHGKWLADA